ncbi:MAG: Chaperone protein TorD [Alphaproteobacteria bacterium MarineAlpha3_Bin2]|nr:MAG: Chaperone protein TorD [Alphaproteobacteria bacterium MarineAlpha3_Bin2]
MGRSGEDVPEGTNSPSHNEKTGELAIPEEDRQRANLYGLLARVLAEPMGDETLEVVRALEGQSDENELGAAFATLGTVAVRTPRGVAEEEFSALFYGDGSGGEILPYASYYLTGFLLEKPLAKLRGDMAVLGIKNSGISKEPEDHIAYLCEIMHGLITGAFNEPASLETQQKFFETHMAPWVGRFFSELEGAESASLYMPVGTIGRLFMAIEAKAFEMAA